MPKQLMISKSKITKGKKTNDYLVYNKTIYHLALSVYLKLLLILFFTQPIEISNRCGIFNKL